MYKICCNNHTIGEAPLLRTIFRRQKRQLITGLPCMWIIQWIASLEHIWRRSICRAWWMCGWGGEPGSPCATSSAGRGWGLRGARTVCKDICSNRWEPFCKRQTHDLCHDQVACMLKQVEMYQVIEYNDKRLHLDSPFSGYSVMSFCLPQLYPNSPL